MFTIGFYAKDIHFVLQICVQFQQERNMMLIQTVESLVCLVECYNLKCLNWMNPCVSTYDPMLSLNLYVLLLYNGWTDLIEMIEYNFHSFGPSKTKQ